MKRRDFLLGGVVLGEFVIAAETFNPNPIKQFPKKLESKTKKNSSLIDPNIYQQNKQLLEETIEISKKNKDFAIIIDKFDYSLNLYSNGNLIKIYPIELGFNPIDDKIKQEDCRTPEGKFYLAAKIPNSSFYRAFLISYPNIESAERGLKSGLITQKEYNAIIHAINEKLIPPQNTQLGNYIEIHGSGSGKKPSEGGNNWTLGCIALSNTNIKELYDSIPLKTPITIVRYGTKNIEDYLN